MLGRRRRRLPELVRSTVVLHLEGGDSIAGLLIGEYDDVVCVARARLLSESSGRAVPMDGEVVVPLAKIRHAQVGVKLDDTRQLQLAQVEGSRGAA